MVVGCTSAVHNSPPSSPLHFRRLVLFSLTHTRALSSEISRGTAVTRYPSQTTHPTHTPYNTGCCRGRLQRVTSLRRRVFIFCHTDLTASPLQCLFPRATTSPLLCPPLHSTLRWWMDTNRESHPSVHRSHNTATNSRGLALINTSASGQWRKSGDSTGVCFSISIHSPPAVVYGYRRVETYATVNTKQDRETWVTVKNKRDEPASEIAPPFSSASSTFSGISIFAPLNHQIDQYLCPLPLSVPQLGSDHTPICMTKRKSFIPQALANICCNEDSRGPSMWGRRTVRYTSRRLVLFVAQNAWQSLECEHYASSFCVKLS